MWFNDAESFASSSDEGEEDLIAHFSDVQGSGFNSCRKSGSDFKVKQGPNCKQATKISRFELATAVLDDGCFTHSVCAALRRRRGARIRGARPAPLQQMNLTN